MSKELIRHSDMVLFDGTNYDENRNFYMEIFPLFPELIEENIVITFLDYPTIYRMMPLMINKSLTRNDKLQILKQHSPTPLCYTGRISQSASFSCNLHMRKNGNLVIFPTTEIAGYFRLDIPSYYCSHKQLEENEKAFVIFGKIIYWLLYIFGTLCGISIIIIIISIMRNGCKCEELEDEISSIETENHFSMHDFNGINRNI